MSFERLARLEAGLPTAVRRVLGAPVEQRELDDLAIVLGRPLPSEVAELYRWHGSTGDLEYVYPYRRLQLWEIPAASPDPRDFPDTRRLVPLMLDRVQRDGLLVDEDGCVFLFSPERISAPSHVAKVYESISDLLDTAQQALESGAMKYEDDGRLRLVDPGAYRSMQQRLHPVLAFWNGVNYR